MGVESAADLAAFFDEGEHALAAVWTLAAGGDTTVSVILNRPFADIAMGEVSVQMDRPAARLAAASLPAGYARGDTLTIDGTAWKVGPVDLDDSRAVASVTLRAV